MYKIILIIAIFASLVFAETDATATEDFNSKLVEMEEIIKEEKLQQKRMLASTLNMFPFFLGLGSFFIMGDIEGGIIQLALASSGLTLMIINEGIFACYENCGNALVFSAGAIMMLSGFIYGIVRPYYYDNSKNTADNKKNKFNMAILPGKQGDFKAYLFYNKTF